MVSKVRKFQTDVPVPGKSVPDISPNVVSDLPKATVDSVVVTAPVKIRAGRGNPRPRRYQQKTYSILQEDIDLLEQIMARIRQAGLYERGRSDIVRAGIHLLNSLSLEEQMQALRNVESLK